MGYDHWILLLGVQENQAPQTTMKTVFTTFITGNAINETKTNLHTFGNEMNISPITRNPQPVRFRLVRSL